MSSEKAISDVTLYVAYLAEQKWAGGECSWRDVGEYLGTSGSNIFNVWNLDTGVGGTVEKEIAKRFHNNDRGTMDRAVAAWRAANPDWLPSSQERWGQLEGWSDAAAALVDEEPSLAKRVRAAAKKAVVKDFKPKRLPVTKEFVRRLLAMYAAVDSEPEEVEARDSRARIERAQEVSSLAELLPARRSTLVARVVVIDEEPERADPSKYDVDLAARGSNPDHSHIARQLPRAQRPEKSPSRGDSTPEEPPPAGPKIRRKK